MYPNGISDSDFETTLNDPTASVAVHHRPGNRTVLIAFGGLIGAIGFPPFEFFNLTRELPVTRIFVRDIRQTWYQRGLPGIADDIDGITAFLRETVIALGAERIVVVGNSMGGYAAIIMGLLLEADAVHAFVPQTFMDRRNVRAHRDDRFYRYACRLRCVRGARYLDLVRLLRKRVHSQCDINVYYATDHTADRIHAERLRGLPTVKLHPFHSGGHELIRQLRDDGRLAKIIDCSLRGSHPPALAASWTALRSEDDVPSPRPRHSDCCLRET